MLSVLSTPWVKPTACHLATSFTDLEMTSWSNPRYGSGLPAVDSTSPLNVAACKVVFVV